MGDIYFHLPYIYSKCRQKYSSPMEHLGFTIEARKPRSNSPKQWLTALLGGLLLERRLTLYCSPLFPNRNKNRKAWLVMSIKTRWGLKRCKKSYANTDTFGTNPEQPSFPNGQRIYLAAGVIGSISPTMVCFFPAAKGIGSTPGKPIWTLKMMVYDRLEKELLELGVSTKELLIKFVSCSLSPLSFHTCSQ